jgi:hypothetical protein
MIWGVLGPKRANTPAGLEEFRSAAAVNSERNDVASTPKNQSRLSLPPPPKRSPAPQGNGPPSFSASAQPRGARR